MQNIILEFSAVQIGYKNIITVTDESIILVKQQVEQVRSKEVLLSAAKINMLYKHKIEKDKKNLAAFNNLSRYTQECCYSYAAKELRKILLNQAEKVKVTFSNMELVFEVKAMADRSENSNETSSLVFNKKDDLNAWGKAIKLVFRKIIYQHLNKPKEALFSVIFCFDGQDYQVSAAL